MRNTKFILLALSVALLTAFFAVATFAATGDVLVNDPDNSNDLVWTFDEATGVMTISGTSAELKLNPAPSWDKMSAETIPWYSVKNNIKTVVITAPVTSICGYAFNQLSNVETIIVPDHTIKFTASMTLANCGKLKTFGPEGTAEGVIDLRKITGESSQCFENSCKEVPVTVLLPYGDEYAMSSGKVFADASDVTFRVTAGTKNEELAKSIKAKAESDPNPSPYADKVAIEYYTGTNDGAPAGGAATDTSAKPEDTNAPTGGETTGDPNTIIAQAEITSQYSNVKWVLTADGTITFTPTASGWNEVPYNSSNDNRWYDYADQIKKAVIEPGLSKVGAGAFKNCVNLEVVEFGGIGQIASGAFENCPKLTTIYKKGNEPVEGVFDLSSVYVLEGSNQFVNCGMTSVDIRSSITAFAENRFVDCAYLTNITFGDKVETINDNAFNGCYNLKVVFGVTGSVVESFAAAKGLTFAEVGADVEIPEAVVTTAEETTTPAPETTKTPESSGDDTTKNDETTSSGSATQTGDINVVMILAFAIAALGSAVVLFRKRSFN